MNCHKAVKVKIHPIVKQRKLLSKHFGATRWVYNYFLERRIKQYKQTKKSDDFYQMSKHLTELKKQIPWLNEVSRQCLLNSIRNLNNAFQSFFKKKANYPKFKRKRNRQSFTTYYPFSLIKPEGIQIPLIGTLKCQPELPEKYKLNFVTISKTVTDKYYVSINITTDIPDPIIDASKPVIGIDFGLKTFIAISDGRKIDHPKPFKQSLRKLKRAQKKLCRRKKGSKRRARQRRRVALIHEKVANQRKDFLHKTSSRLVSENQAIFLEDLSIEGMKKQYGRQINDLGWNIFEVQLDYKGKWYDCFVDRVPRFYPSSKICHICGYINHDLKLKDREWTCPRCLTLHDRDENAAINIKEYGSASRNLRTGRVEIVNSLVEPSRQETC